jgi:hypothetical protein
MALRASSVATAPPGSPGRTATRPCGVSRVDAIAYRCTRVNAATACSIRSAAPNRVRLKPGASSGSRHHENQPGRGWKCAHQ